MLRVLRVLCLGMVLLPLGVCAQPKGATDVISWDFILSTPPTQIGFVIESCTMTAGVCPMDERALTGPMTFAAPVPKVAPTVHKCYQVRTVGKDMLMSAPSNRLCTPGA